MARRGARNGRAVALGLLAGIGAGVSVADCTVVDFVLSGAGGKGGSGGATSSTTSGSSGGGGVAGMASGTTSSSSTGGGGGGAMSGGGGMDGGTTSDGGMDGGGTCDTDSGMPVTGLTWYKGFGGAGNQVAHAIALDGQGHLAITGTFSYSTDFGNTTLDAGSDTSIFLAKYATDGSPVWAKGFDNSNYPWAMGLAFDDAGDTFVAGQAQHLMIPGFSLVDGAFAARFDASAGAPVWMTAGTGGSGGARAIAVDSVGDVVITGSFGGTPSFGCPALPLPTASAHDVFVAKLRGTDGACLWSKSLGGGAMSDAAGWGVAIPRKGMFKNEVFVIGSFDGALTSCPNPPSSQGAQDIFVAHLLSDGTCTGARGFGDGAAQVGRSIAISDDDVVIAGDSAGPVDLGGGPIASGMFVAKLAGVDLQHVWSVALGLADPSPDDQYHPKSVRVAVDPQQNVVLTGEFLSGSTTDYHKRDLFVEKRSQSGVLVWRDVFGANDGNDQVGYGIAADDAGVFMAGGFSTKIVFGCEDAGLDAAGRDVLLARLQP